MAEHREIDEATGVATTGHSWDGVKELDNPLPRWWLYIFYATILWAVVYWVLMPAWPLPNGYTPGVRGHSDRAVVQQEVAESKARHAPFYAQLTATSLTAAQTDPNLSAFALAAGQALFGDNCATCHGAGGQGAAGGYPNLGDENWIWGGSVEDIAHTIRHGVRQDEPEQSRRGAMTVFGPTPNGPGILTPRQINEVSEYVVQLGRGPADPAAATAGAAIYREHCALCHGATGAGDRARGAPNLTDAEWLMAGPQASVAGDWGAIRASIVAQVRQPKLGAMPAWSTRLEEGQVRALALYVHSLGGGERGWAPESGAAPAPTTPAAP